MPRKKQQVTKRNREESIQAWLDPEDAREGLALRTFKRIRDEHAGKNAKEAIILAFLHINDSIEGGSELNGLRPDIVLNREILKNLGKIFSATESLTRLAAELASGDITSERRVEVQREVAEVQDEVRELDELQRSMAMSFSEIEIPIEDDREDW